MGQNRDGFLHPAGALTAREKNGLSAAPARPLEPPAGAASMNPPFRLNTERRRSIADTDML